MSESIQGACLCRETKISIKIPPGGDTQGLCHCTDCKHTSGSAFSTNILIPKDDILITGAHVREYSSTAASGNTISRIFCANCGSALSHRSTFLDAMQPVQTGNFYAHFKDTPIVVEFFTKDRWSGLPEIKGAMQVQAMPPPPPVQHVK